MRLFSVFLIAGGVFFVILAFMLAVTKGVLNLSVLDVYARVLPRYLLLIGGLLVVSGWFVRRWAFAHP